MKKKFWQSKTLYVNVLGIIAVFFGQEFLSTDMQVKILAGINIVLRFVTKDKIEW